MSFVERQQRVRVLEALERRVKQFRRREELFPLRIPHEPLPLAEVIDEALGDDARRFDASSLRGRPLLHLVWDDGSVWELWVLVLPSKVKVYCDAGTEEARVLASGGRNEGDETDRIFLQLLGESGGAHFGLEMAGAAPQRVRSSIGDREFLLDFFVELFEVSRMEGAIRSRAGTALIPAGGTDFRADVDRWLEAALA